MSSTDADHSNGVIIDQSCDFFSRLPTIHNYVEEDVQLQAPIIASAQNYIFDVLPSETRFTENKFILITKWCILTDDNNPIPESTHVAPCDLAHQTMWNRVRLSLIHRHRPLYMHMHHLQVEYRLNDSIIEGGTSNNYHYMSYACSRLGYGAGSVATWLQLQGHYPDTAGFYESSDPKLNKQVNAHIMYAYMLHACFFCRVACRGFQSRMDMCANSRQITTVGALMLHSCESKKHLPPVFTRARFPCKHNGTSILAGHKNQYNIVADVKRCANASRQSNAWLQVAHYIVSLAYRTVRATADYIAVVLSSVED